MPIYEYQCEACGHRFELLQKLDEAPASSCTECGGRVERLLSTPAIQFKGTGWYVTDYARKGSGASGESSSSGSKDGSSTETSSETSRAKSGPAASASSTSKD